MTFGIFTLMMMTLLAFRKFSIICRKCDDFWHFFCWCWWLFWHLDVCKFSMICQKWDDFWHFYIDADDSFGIWLCKFSMIWLLAFYADDSFGILMFLQICQKSWAQLWWRCKLSRRCQSLFWENHPGQNNFSCLMISKLKGSLIVLNWNTLNLLQS